MNRTGFHYRIEATVTFTGQEIPLLFENSQPHYDARCRAMSKPAHSDYGGEVWALLNQFVWNLDPEPPWLPDEKQDAYFRRVCLENPHATVICNLPFRRLDLFAKCLEMANPEPVANALRSSLRATLQAINDEHDRLNPPEVVAP